MDRIAVLSDVHGNVTALLAVLADIRERGIETIYNLGDVAGKGPRGAEAIRLVREHCRLTVRGNWDDFLPHPADDWQDSVRWWHDELGTAEREWLTGLPLSHDLAIAGRRLRLLHASATSVYTRVHFDHSTEQFEGMFLATELTGPAPSPDVVLYGDIHDAYVENRGGRILANAGSVGNALDEPTAAYLVLEGALDAPVDTRPLAARPPFALQIVRVPYDVESEIAAAGDLGMPELDAYAVELRTGVYRGLHAGLGLR